MAKLLGKPQFSGRTGNLVHATWNGRPYVRMRPHWKGRYKPTPAQILNQKKFKYAMLLMRDFRELLKLTVEFEIGQSTSSSAMKALLNDAIVGVHPDLSVDFSRMQVARGSLPPATNAKVESTGTGLKFSWADETERDKEYFLSHSILVAYNPETNDVFYELNGPIRTRLSGEMNIPEFWRDKELHTWISFRSVDFKLKANSVYTGVITVSAGT